MRRSYSALIGLILIGLQWLPGPAIGRADIQLPEGFSYQVYVDNLPTARSLAFDSQGYLYITVDQPSIQSPSVQIYRVSPLDKSVTTFGPYLHDPDSIAIDARDNVILGSGDGVLYRVSPTENIITPIGSPPLLGNICSLAIDDYGWLQPRGTLLVGNAQSLYNYDIVTLDRDDQLAKYISSPYFDIPYSMVFADVNGLFVIENDTDTPGLYRINGPKNIQQVVSFPAPISIAFNRVQRLLYVGDIVDQRIYQVTLGGKVTVFAENISAYGLTFGPDDCLYVTEPCNSNSRVLKITGFPAPLPATINLDPDLIQVTQDENDITVPPLDESLKAYITLPRGYPIANFDVNTLALSLNHLVLANAEDPVIDGGTLQVCFPLALETMSTIVGRDVSSFAIEDSDRSIHVTAAQPLTHNQNLITLEVFGRGKDGKVFRGKDTIRLVSAP